MQVHFFCVRGYIVPNHSTVYCLKFQVTRIRKQTSIAKSAQSPFSRFGNGKCPGKENRPNNQSTLTLQLHRGMNSDGWAGKIHLCHYKNAEEKSECPQARKIEWWSECRKEDRDPQEPEFESHPPRPRRPRQPAGTAVSRNEIIRKLDRARLPGLIARNRRWKVLPLEFFRIGKKFRIMKLHLWASFFLGTGDPSEYVMIKYSR